MDRFTELLAFVAVAETGSISRAAERLGTTKSVVSRRLADLEARLEVRLLNRVARGVTLTDPGSRFYDRAPRLLADLAEAEEEATAGHVTLRGPLRVAAPVSFSTLYLADALTQFSARYPEVVLDLDLDDRAVDLVNGGYDLAVRIGRLPDSSLVARTLAPHRHVLCASPAYLAARGPIETPEALRAHDALVYSNRDANPVWRLGRDGGTAASFRVRPRLRINNGDILRDYAIAGLGVAILPTFIAAPPIRAGALVVVLPGWAPPVGAISLIYPAGRRPVSKVRALIDHLVAAIGPTPPWDVAIAAAGNGRVSVAPGA